MRGVRSIKMRIWNESATSRAKKGVDTASGGLRSISDRLNVQMPAPVVSQGSINKPGSVAALWPGRSLLDRTCNLDWPTPPPSQ